MELENRVSDPVSNYPRNASTWNVQSYFSSICRAFEGLLAGFWVKRSMEGKARKMQGSPLKW